MSALAAADRAALLALARRAVADHLAERVTPLPDGPPALLALRATFVTLRHRDGTLRGCRGEVRASRPLAASVCAMAVASATDDPRFPPVTARELADVRCGISVLSPLEPIRVEQVEVGRHGLYLVQGRRAGLLLPEVPVTFGWDRDAFLAGLCEKAGLPGSVLTHPGTALYGFETDAWGDDDQEEMDR